MIFPDFNEFLSTLASEYFPTGFSTINRDLWFIFRICLKNRMALISRSLVPGSLQVLSLAPIPLRANGHNPAEATRQRLLTFKVHMSCRHCASQLASFGRLLVFGPWAAQPSVESAGGMEVMPRWTAEGCAPAATSTTWPLCGTSLDCYWCRFQKTRSSRLIFTSVVSHLIITSDVNVIFTLWIGREEH